MMVLVGSKGAVGGTAWESRRTRCVVAVVGGRQEHATRMSFSFSRDLSLSLSLLCVALSLGLFQSRAGSAAAWTNFPDRFACAVAAGEGGGQVKSVTVYLETPGVEKKASWCWTSTLR